MVLNFLTIIISFLVMTFDLKGSEFSRTKNTKNSIKPIAKIKIEVKKYFRIGFFTFQNKSRIKTPDTEYSKLNYTTSGLVFGYDESITNGSLKLGTNLNLFYGNTDARSESNDLYYFKKELPTYGAIGGLSFLFALNRGGKYYLGPEANIYYISTKWFIPQSTNGPWTIEKTAKAQFSFLLSGEYYHSNIMFYHKFGYPIGGTSFIWNLGVGIQL